MRISKTYKILKAMLPGCVTLSAKVESQKSILVVAFGMLVSDLKKLRNVVFEGLFDYQRKINTKCRDGAEGGLLTEKR